MYIYIYIVLYTHIYMYVNWWLAKVDPDMTKVIEKCLTDFETHEQL